MSDIGFVTWSSTCVFIGFLIDRYLVRIMDKKVRKNVENEVRALFYHYLIEYKDFEDIIKRKFQIPLPEIKKNEI